MPSKVGQPAAVCTNCVGANSVGELNAGKPTYPYAAPLTSFVGRYVDSNATQSVQHLGMRTVRAGLVRVASNTRGSAPPRVYVQLGETLAAYSLNTFFSTKLPGAMVPINTIPTGSKYGQRNPFERIALFDAYVYPESSSSGGWVVPVVDNQDRLHDFDFDDRGFVYLAFDEFGWGIVSDNGATNSSHLPKVSQLLPGETGGISPRLLANIKTNGKYYTIISNPASPLRTAIYDVTTPATPTARPLRSGASNGITDWSKDDDRSRLALLHGDGKVRIYDYAAYISGSGPLEELTGPSGGKFFKNPTFDDQGNLWILQSSKNPEPNVMVKLTPSGSGYSQTTLSPYPQAFSPKFMHAAFGYLAVGGTIMSNGKVTNELYLYKIEGNGLRLLDTDDFFRKYYHAAPTGYAQPGGFTNTPIAVQIVKQGTKTYLMYSAYGLGDVYQLGADGPVMNVTVDSAPYGTTNPNAQPSQTGPFPGDPVTFKATVTPTAAHNLNWSFGNTDAGSANTRTGTTGVDITHQFTGLNTTAKITTPKIVTATATTDSELTSSLTVSLKVPEARIAIKATDELVTESNFDVVYGDQFVDASDGSIESHVSTWTVGGSTSMLRPDGEVSVGPLGTRSVALTASYGKYEPSPLTLPPLAYNAILTAKTYSVHPFIAKLGATTRSGSTVTYTGTSRHTTDTSVLSATEWTVHWTLKTGVVERASLTETVPVGTVPNFSFDNGLLLTGSTVTLEISVDESEVSDPDYNSFSASTVVSVPDPVIQLTNCGYVNDTCSIKALSDTPDVLTDNWQLSWVVKRGVTTVKTGTGNPLAAFKLTTAGSYTVTVTETIFDISVSEQFDVAESLCGAPPMEHELAINSSCTSCSVGQTISFSPSLFGGYTRQDCDEFSWKFGDGAEAEGYEVSHSFSSARTYTVSLTVSNSTNPTGTKVTKSLTIGGGGDGGSGGTCTAPSNITISYSNTQGCAPGTNCKTGDSIRFTAKRGSNDLQGCDEVQWNFGDGSQSGLDSPFKTYTTPGTYTVTATVSNRVGEAPVASRPITVVSSGGTGGCGDGPTIANVSVSYTGSESGCTKNNGVACKPGELINFVATFFQYQVTGCDRFEWNFGDGSALGVAQNPSHTYASNRTTPANVSLKVYTTSNPTGLTLSTTVSFGQVVPQKPLPVLSFQSFPTSGAKGSPVTFNVLSNIPATDWFFDFGDGKSGTQPTHIGTSTSIQHTYDNAGTYNVTVRARNAEDVATATKGSVLGTGLVISDTPEYKFLLPVVTHSPGQNGSVWRTDVQIYTPDPSVTPSNPLRMTATLRDIPATLEVRSSTFTYEDFMRVFTQNNDSGPVIITVRSAHVPQIWTRTYNQTESGTFGQFIPAVRIDAAAGSGSAFGSGKYYMAGLHHDDRFRTNLGFVNPNAQNVNINVRVYDDERFPLGQFSLQLSPYQFDQFPINAPGKGVENLPKDRPFSIEIEVPQGQWLIAYGSEIDQASNDPSFVQAVRESELTLADYGQGVIPGVGHVGEWRSDVTIFNPDAQGINVDLAYYDQQGNMKAEAKGIPIHGGEFVQYKDFLKQGVFGTVADSLGILRVTVPSTFPPARYPLTFARTYNDKGTGKTFGQGIGGFASARANVKPGKPALVPGIRSNENYYTNVGLVNPSNATVTATVKRLDPNSGAEHTIQQHQLLPNQSIVARVELGDLQTASLKIEATGGNLWAFCSIVDKGTNDGEYVVAAPLP